MTERTRSEPGAGRHSGGGPVRFTLAELAERIGGRVEGDPAVLVTGIAGLEDAAPGTLVRVEHPRYLAAALASPAAALLLPTEIGPTPKPAIRVPAVRLAFVQCLELFAPAERPDPGIHPTAVVGAGAEVDPTASVGAYVVIGAGARIGPRAVIHPHAVLGEGVEIGPDSVIHPHAVLYARTAVGARVVIHSGAVLGADGYGYLWDGERHRKIPQLGRVRLGDDVEVGANTTIDRATTGETVIGPGTKIDNQVQVGHNVRTGAHCLLVAQTGIAGSATLGNGVVLAGQTGVKDHVTVGDGVQAGGRAGIWSDVEPGALLSGNPARPFREAMRIEAALARLPELLRRVRELERRLEAAGLAVPPERTPGNMEPADAE